MMAIFDKAMRLRRLRAAATSFEESFWSGGSLDDLFDRVGQRPVDPMSAVFAAAMREWRRSAAKGLTASDKLRASLQDRVPQSRIYKTWNVPGYNTRDFTLLQIAGEVLAGGKNSRLYKRLVYTDQVATSVSAGVGPFEIGSQFQVVATVKPGNILFELDGVTESVARESLRLAADKLPVRTKFLIRHHVAAA